MSKQHLPHRFLIAAMAIVSVATPALASRETVDRTVSAPSSITQTATPDRATLRAPVLLKISEPEVAQSRALAPTALLLTCRRVGARMVC